MTLCDRSKSQLSSNVLTWILEDLLDLLYTVPIPSVLLFKLLSYVCHRKRPPRL